MLSCLAFVAMAQTIPSFMALPRGSARLESGEIAGNKIEDTRTFLKAQDNAHFYLVESVHGPLKRYVEKVPQRGLPAEFCGIMHVDFTQTAGSNWSFSGRLTDDFGGGPVSGLVDTSRSYFHNHVWVDSPELIHLEVSPLPIAVLTTLDLTQVQLCEEGNNGLAMACGPAEDLSHLKE